MNSHQHSARHLLLPLYLVGVNTCLAERKQKLGGACVPRPRLPAEPGCKPGLGGASGARAFPQQPLNTRPQLRGSFAIPPVHRWVVLSRSANTHMAIKCQG